MNNIAGLKPTGIWKYFNEILQIPRPSKKEEKIRAYLVAFAKELNLQFLSDEIGNIVIKKPATKGFEKLKTVVLQSHIDMVCEKNSDVAHNFETDPIKAYIDGDWVKAEGTTLGADNGIGIAAQLAVLTDTTLRHGPIECLFTVDEETGLTGAARLEQGMIEGKILLNLDSEDDGEIFIGCAGGVDTLASIDVETVELPKNHSAISLNITGLKGGHSGDDINKGRANAVKLLCRCVWNIGRDFDGKLGDLQGGNLRNALPREASAIILLPNKNLQACLGYISEYESIIQAEYELSDPSIQIKAKETSFNEEVLSKEVQEKTICALHACPNGVIAMSQSIDGLVETSTNLASVHLKANTIETVTSQRSSVESARNDIASRVKSVFYLANAQVTHTDSYPGWAPNTDSEILQVASKRYFEMFAEEPKVRAIHAGLECGLLLDKYPALDMISFGPTILGAHSPDERMQISTVSKFWNYLVDLLQNIPPEA